MNYNYKKNSDWRRKKELTFDECGVFQVEILGLFLGRRSTSLLCGIPRTLSISIIQRIHKIESDQELRFDFTPIPANSIV